MDLIIGQYQDEDKNDVVFKWNVEYLTRPGPCFNCAQPIEAEQDRWDAVYGAGNNHGMELRVEAWALPPGIRAVQGFEQAGELIGRYVVREGAASRAALPGAAIRRGDAQSAEAFAKARLQAVLRAEKSKLSRQRDFAQQVAKLQGNAEAADVLKELE